MTFLRLFICALAVTFASSHGLSHDATSKEKPVICEVCGMQNCTMGCAPATTTAKEKTGTICKGCGMVDCPMGCESTPSPEELTPEMRARQCGICGMIDCKMGCKAETVNAYGDKLMVMPGLPDWLFYAGIAAVLAVSFIVAEIVGRKTPSGQSWRYNMLEIKALKTFIKKPYFQFALQIIPALGFIWLIYVGLFGHQVINVVPTFTWTIWWAGLIFFVLFGGKVWCLVCPWDLISTVTSRLRFWGTGEGGLNLGLKWPRSLRNIGPAIFFFILLTWLELGWHVTTSPRFTIYIAIGILAMTLVPALLFAKKPFCRHACFIGRITGLYSTFSPVEVRAADKEVCKSCNTRDCFAGNELGNPCPTSLCLATLDDNTYCIKCGECVKSCPNDNVAINLRPFAEDLHNYTGPRLDEAILAIVLLSLTSFHGLTMTPLWENVPNPEGTVIHTVATTLNLGRLAAFTVGMGAVLLAPILLYLAICWLTEKIAKLCGMKDAPGFGEIFIKFSYSVLPIALFYHLAHNGMHLFMEGQNLFTLLSDPLGRGWDLFGTAKATYPPILGKDIIWVCQVLLVVIGHVYGIIIAQKVSMRLFGKGRIATVIQLPLLFAMILFSFISLWLMHLDMNMRGTLM